MASSQALGGTSRAGRILGPSFDKIIKNTAWRKHANLVSACKAALDRLETLAESPDPGPGSPLVGIPLADAEIVLDPLVLAVDSGAVKVAEPALECAHKLFLNGHIRGDVDHRSDGDDGLNSASRLVDSICKCGGMGDEGIELAMLRVLTGAVRSPAIALRGACLVQIVKSCYNVYLGSHSGDNQLCAKAILAQILAIVYARVEADAMVVNVHNVSIADILDLSDKNLNDSNLVQFAQNFINDVMVGSVPSES